MRAWVQTLFTATCTAAVTAASTFCSTTACATQALLRSNCSLNHAHAASLQLQVTKVQQQHSCQPLLTQAISSLLAWHQPGSRQQRPCPTTLMLQQLQHYRLYSNRGNPPSSKRLGEILKLELLHNITADEVEHIWMKHYEASTTHVATVLSRDEHTAMAARAAASPLFVLPLCKPPKGFCTFLVQWQQQKQQQPQQQQALVTTLEEYKQVGSNAPAHFTVDFYTDVADTHGVVLARGDVLKPELISAPEGQIVMELMRVLYTDPESYQLVYAFNHQPDKFNFGVLLQQLGISSSI